MAVDGAGAKIDLQPVSANLAGTGRTRRLNAAEDIFQPRDQFVITHRFDQIVIAPNSNPSTLLISSSRQVSISTAICP